MDGDSASAPPLTPLPPQFAPVAGGPCIVVGLTTAPDPAGPSSLADLRRGMGVPGESGIPPLQLPPWLDMQRCLQVNKFWKRNAFSLTIAWHCSLTIGFSLPRLLQALVFTHASDTPETSLKRYMRTAAHLASWHAGNIWDPASATYKSVQAVRKLHAGVRTQMDAHMPGNTWISMYDMAIVQSGFMGAASIFPQKLGMHASSQELEDYIYFWRCVGHQLGISDEYNLCSRGKLVADTIVWEIMSTILLPDIANPPEDYDRIAKAYIDGLNLLTLRIPVFSVKSTLAVVYWGLGIERGRLGPLDTCRYGFLRLLLLLMGWLPVCRWFFNRAALASVQQVRHLASSPAGDLQCPFSGVAMGALQRSLDHGRCPYASAGAQGECRAHRGLARLPTFNPLGLALLSALITILFAAVAGALALLVLLTPTADAAFRAGFVAVEHGCKHLLEFLQPLAAELTGQPAAGAARAS